MNPLPPVRLLCALLLFVSAPVMAMPVLLSEQLGDWHRATAPNPEAAPAAAAPLRLKHSGDIRQSIIRELVLLKGRAMLGKRYTYGASNDAAVDCSALIRQLYLSAGIDLPRTSQDLKTIGKPVSRHALLPGDLLFYRWKKHGLHVAIYAGDGLVLHASPAQRSVVMTTLNQAWRHHFVEARRVMMQSAA